MDRRRLHRRARSKGNPTDATTPALQQQGVPVMHLGRGPEFLCASLRQRQGMLKQGNQQRGTQQVSDARLTQAIEVVPFQLMPELEISNDT